MKASDFHAAIAIAVEIATDTRDDGSFPNQSTQIHLFIGALKGGLDRIDPKLAAQVDLVGWAGIERPAREFA